MASMSSDVAIDLVWPAGDLEFAMASLAKAGHERVYDLAVSHLQ